MDGRWSTTDLYYTGKMENVMTMSRIDYMTYFIMILKEMKVCSCEFQEVMVHKQMYLTPI